MSNKHPNDNNKPKTLLSLAGINPVTNTIPFDPSELWCCTACDVLNSRHADCCKFCSDRD